MAKQSFLTSGFFANASEQEARRVVCSLPQHFSHLTLLKENAIANSIRFLYEVAERKTQIYIDVSILMLDNIYVCLNLHGSYTNGQKIQSDADILTALRLFEEGVQGSLKNDFSFIQRIEASPETNRKPGFLNRLLVTNLFFKSPA